MEPWESESYDNEKEVKRPKQRLSFFKANVGWSMIEVVPNYEGRCSTQRGRAPLQHQNGGCADNQNKARKMSSRKKTRS